jgi:putative transcriptional regulator
MINHHPPDELLFDFAAGSVPEAVALIVATHVAMCPSCRRAVAQAESLGAVLLEGIEPEPLDESALDAVLARLDEPEVLISDPSSALDAQTRHVIPAPLRPYIGRSLSELPWRSFGRLFQEVQLPLASKAVKASLMRLRPSSLMPNHTHRGNEYTLVLAGGYSDAGRQFGPGDFDIEDMSRKHQPKVDDDEECLCLVVLDAPLKLSGPLGLLVNPFLRM